MAEPKPLTIAKLFSDLTGQSVNFTQVLKPMVSKATQAYGTYLIKPMDSARIIQLDLPLLGSLGGALLGIPSNSVQDCLKSPVFDGGLLDAVREILNVASTIVSIDNRAVFQADYLDSALVPKDILDSLKNPAFRSYFTVTISGYVGGAFSIFAPI